jgi:hypothetical protein
VPDASPYLGEMRDSAAKTIFVVTLHGDRGPYSRADLIEAVRAGDVQRGDQARSAFGRPLGTVAQVLGSPSSDRAPIIGRSGTPPPRPAAKPIVEPKPWRVPLLIALVVVILIAGLMAARPGADPLPPPVVQPTSQAPEPGPPATAPIPQPPTAAIGDVLPGLAEANGFRLVCDLDLRQLGSKFSYRIDNRSRAGTFDRIAYLVELTTGKGPNHYVWTAMDAFTTDGRRIGVPTLSSKGFFQTAVTNLQVRSNAPGVTAGDFPSGNIEFWPCFYKQARSKDYPTASNSAYDFSDTPTLADDGRVTAGYGCMQVHNPDLKQTLFAINHWDAGKTADLGLGNAPGPNPDWTFIGNADSYSRARLRVLIRPR